MIKECMSGYFQFSSKEDGLYITVYPPKSGYGAASIDDVMELYCDISQLDVMSNLEIDSAKRENPANNTRELQLLKKKYDVRDKKNRHIRPLFFKYIDGIFHCLSFK